LALISLSSFSTSFRFRLRSEPTEDDEPFLCSPVDDLTDDVEDETLLLRRTNFSKLLASLSASKHEASFLMGERREVVSRATRRGGLAGAAEAATTAAAQQNTLMS
jgi:hypothetical protein